MGNSHGDFVKYPRTPHLFGSKGTADDRHLNPASSATMLADESLIVEEKLDGTNVGLHFVDGDLILQCRGHLITDGMHPQYDLFKQWAFVKRNDLEDRLRDRYILFGEWLYARHSVFYQSLPHYFFEFDIYDKEQAAFLDLAQRTMLLEGSGILTVPIIHNGPISRSGLDDLIAPSVFESHFEHAGGRQTDNLMEGLYLRTESDGRVIQRAKWVRPEFVRKIQAGSHWQYQAMTSNQLAPDADIWA